jgi:outer membrane biosynthesis protein TonB
MLAKAWRQLRERPFAGIAVSLAIHLAILAALLWVGGPSSIYTVKRGEPLFVELPQADESAQRGAPPPEQKPAPPAPRIRPTPPAPRVAAPPPKPASPPSRPEPRAPERPAPATTPPAAPEAPSGELPRVASAPPKAAEIPPPPSEPARTPEPPREATPPSPAPPRVAAVPESPPPAPDIRKALRRGGPGPGGAGGRGEGWSGIEGEPIPLDSTDPKFNDYLDRIRRMIKEKWGYPCIKDLATGHCDYKSARLVIVFGILKDGRVPMLEVAQQSGYDVYDDYAVNAIKLASPFPPVPASLMASAKSGSAGVKIVAAFQYVLVESSLTNILR